MKAPICGICLSSDILCMACKRKLDEGKISEVEVRVARAVHGLAKTYRLLKDVAINRVVEGGGITVIVCGKGDRSRMIGREGMIINRLSKSIGKAVRVVEGTDSVREFVQDLIRPVPVLGMNVVYNRGNETLKIIIPKGRDIPMPRSSLAGLIRIVFGRDSVVVAHQG